MSIDILKTLQSSTLFRCESIEVLEWVVENCEVRSAKAGTVLIYPAMLNDELLIVAEGRFKIVLDQKTDYSISYIEPGDCAGEMSIIEHDTTSAHVVVDHDSRYLAIPSEVVWSLINKSNVVARNLLHILSSRLRNDHDLLKSGLEQQLNYERVSKIDALSGLYNRRWLEEMLPRYINRNRRNQKPLSLLLVDIDHFKEVNDRYGHLVGDCIIAQVAKIVADSVRPEDAAIRYGGDEFMVILPETGQKEAKQVAERLADKIRGQEHNCGKHQQPLPPVTVSIGAAGSDSGIDYEQLFRATDQALYYAKDAGRDCVCEAV